MKHNLKSFLAGSLLHLSALALTGCNATGKNMVSNDSFPDYIGKAGGVAGGSIGYLAGGACGGVLGACNAAFETYKPAEPSAAHAHPSFPNLAKDYVPKYANGGAGIGYECGQSIGEWGGWLAGKAIVGAYWGITTGGAKIWNGASWASNRLWNMYSSTPLPSEAEVEAEANKYNCVNVSNDLLLIEHQDETEANKYNCVDDFDSIDDNGKFVLIQKPFSFLDALKKACKTTSARCM